MVGVIGATGHLGNVLSRSLIEKGEKVIGIVPEGEDLTPIKGLPLEIRYADVRNYESLKNALDGVDYVFHTAGVISISKGDWDKLYSVNVVGTRNVVEACLELKIKRLVFTSSVHAFKEPKKGAPITEDLPLAPLYGDYAKSKAMATEEVIKGIKCGLDAVIVAPTGIIGPFDYKVSEMGMLIVNYMKSKMFFYVNGAYDFVDVRDVAQGEILAMEKGKSGEIYILSGGQITVEEIAHTLREVSQKKIIHICMPMFLAHFAALFTPIIARITKEKPLFTAYSLKVIQSNSLVSSKKAEKELGYTTRPVKESLRDAYVWFHEQNAYINKNSICNSEIVKSEPKPKNLRG